MTSLLVELDGVVIQHCRHGGTSSPLPASREKVDRRHSSRCAISLECLPLY
jgi:hypothetical protein